VPTPTGNYLNLGTNQALYEDGGYVDGGGNTFIGTCNPSSDLPVSGDGTPDPPANPR